MSETRASNQSSWQSIIQILLPFSLRDLVPGH